MAALLTASCSDDESWAPPFLTDFAELGTDGNGVIESMTLDNGVRYESARLVVKCAEGDGLTPDSIYRAVCVYTRMDNVATLYNYTRAFAPEPISPDVPANGEIKTDPCIIQSIWRGGDYINALMLVQGKNQPHIVGFIDEGIAGEEYKELTIQLYHDQNKDTEAFTRTIYLSCPLRQYAGQLVSGRDSIVFVVNEQDKGMATYKLPY